MELQNKLTCQHEGCTNEAQEWVIDQDETGPHHFNFCYEHAGKFGFCVGCRYFCGGIESFEFGPGAQYYLCQECYDYERIENGLNDDDDDDDDYYDYEELENG